MNEAKLTDRVPATPSSSGIQCVAQKLKTTVLSIDFANQETGRYFNFTNIPYALPPTGDRRFRAPLAIESKSSMLDNGSIGHICPQAYPDWITISGEFMQAYLLGESFDEGAAWGSLATQPPPPPDPRVSEDCLVLDVLVPEKVWDAVSSGQTPQAEVLVWIYGGGFVFGSKDFWGNPAGLIEASRSNGRDGIIYVAMNYRVGAFGFLAGPSLQADGAANAGLLDQHLALQWVQDNIHLFGGSKDRVTVMGESAGGASIMHHLTAFGALNGPPLFSRAIVQSPGSQPQPGAKKQEDAHLAFLELLNVSSIEEARMLPSDVLIEANEKQISASKYGIFAYGSTPDGFFAPDFPTRMLVQGSHFKDIEVLVSHNTNEGLTLVNPGFQNSTDAETERLFEELIRAQFPSVSSDIVQHILQTLYPPIYDGSQGYTDTVERISEYIGDAILKNTANAISRAYGNASYAYEYSIGPALHADDVPYTFFNGASSRVPAPGRALELQEYLTTFAIHGVPSSGRATEFPTYGTGVLKIQDDGYSVVADSTANERNTWWQKTLCKFLAASSCERIQANE
ncbi:uncharacterized protein A1O9_00229 [Exophiala aquamarina CBS 119918]|uniref:Carboxylic ester hydrolase n=1 Tax=Exophiala aquamarina CBS 119918 TaxID=1182545 RepID=A0A072PRB0_9EURO|nr:uncharacterized protein A1O9_00229 [Exophiala aquamarina CBS 119918]KEF62257.1 hypothetical protein A1O9_00229 [Exophiala aquamarina CBS 119918]